MRRRAYALAWIVRCSAGICLSMLLVAAGCAEPKIQFLVGNEVYDTADQALDRVERMHLQVLSEIPPLPGPTHATAAVVVPTAQRIRRTSLSLSDDVTKEQVEYLIRYTQETNRGMYRAVMARRLFEHLELIEADEPESHTSDALDYILYYNNPSPGLGAWYLRSCKDGSVRLIPMDSSQAVGAARTLAWLNAIEETVRAGLRSAGSGGT